MRDIGLTFRRLGNFLSWSCFCFFLIAFSACTRIMISHSNPLLSGGYQGRPSRPWFRVHTTTHGVSILFRGLGVNFLCQGHRFANGCFTGTLSHDGSPLLYGAGILLPARDLNVRCSEQLES
jgi:hypothetical protein